MKHIGNGWKLYFIGSMCFTIAALIEFNIAAGFCVMGICFVAAAFFYVLENIE